jgi:alkanesulfonate monooxygenase SsuD/methylene tetrahydromethanopterin reductase-like flavin-dependent oxidoreductase (luciferase family)
MTGIIFPRDWAGVERQLKDEDSWWYDQTPEELRQEGLIVGTSEKIGEQLQQYSTAGVQRIMLQWLDQDDLEGLEALTGSVLSNT